jgi:hypothetical protein
MKDNNDQPSQPSTPDIDFARLAMNDQLESSDATLVRAAGFISDAINTAGPSFVLGQLSWMMKRAHEQTIASLNAEYANGNTDTESLTNRAMRVEPMGHVANLLLTASMMVDGVHMILADSPIDTEPEIEFRKATPPDGDAS